VRAAVLFNDVGAVDIDAKLIVGSRVTRSTSPTAASAAPAAMIWWGMLPVPEGPRPPVHRIHSWSDLPAAKITKCDPG